MHGIATGGDGVARDADGRVVFVRGALPGDVVEAEVTSERKRFAHARMVRVLTPGSARREPTCRHVADGCGGCDLQHASPVDVADLKRQIVVDTLERIGRIPGPPVVVAGTVDPVGYRTTVRVAVDRGRAGFRRAQSHDVVLTPGCEVAHPLVRQVLDEGRFPDADEVVVRASVADGDVVTVVTPRAGRASVPRGRVFGRDHIDAGSMGDVVEEVAGRRFRVSANSFFQSGPAAAELLVDRVDAAVGGTDAGGALVDLYSGIGLFAGTVTYDGRRVAVEVSPSSVADARENLADLDVEVIEADVERWTPVPADVVIADPARRGLGSRGVPVAVGTGAPTIVLVSCDPGALGRDARLLVEAGYGLERAEVLDLFPGTSHVEVVSRFTRSAAQNRRRAS